MTCLDVGEMGLVRELNTFGIDMLLHSAVVTRPGRAFDVVDGSLDRYPNKASGLCRLATRLLFLRLADIRRSRGSRRSSRAEEAHHYLSLPAPASAPIP